MVVVVRRRGCCPCALACLRVIWMDGLAISPLVVCAVHCSPVALWTHRVHGISSLLLFLMFTPEV